MLHRLSLSERNELAFKVRACALGSADPDQLEAMADPRFQPHERVMGIYAFEFLLDGMRKKMRAWKLRGKLERAIAHNVEWSKKALVRDEEPKNLEKLIRMSANVFLDKLEESGGFKLTSESLRKTIAKTKLPIREDEHAMLAYELWYEIVIELTREFVMRQK